MSLASLESQIMFHADVEGEKLEERTNFEALWAQVDMHLLDENVAMSALHNMWGYAKKPEIPVTDLDPAVEAWTQALGGKTLKLAFAEL